MEPHVPEILARIEARPQDFFPNANISCLYAFFSGMRHAGQHLIPAGFTPWLSQRLSSQAGPRATWLNILLMHTEGSDTEAYRLFFPLIREYFQQAGT